VDALFSRGKKKAPLARFREFSSLLRVGRPHAPHRAVAHFGHIGTLAGSASTGQSLSSWTYGDASSRSRPPSFALGSAFEGSSAAVAGVVAVWSPMAISGYCQGCVVKGQGSVGVLDPRQGLDCASSPASCPE